MPATTCSFRESDPGTELGLIQTQMQTIGTEANANAAGKSGPRNLRPVYPGGSSV